MHYLICPKCNGELVKRNGKNVYFLSCSNYPKCNHTESI
ncbi:topoisomerase DNA-binding C4 zinc finger domain-containing protein [Staphylococcus pseudintermedius]